MARRVQTGFEANNLTASAAESVAISAGVVIETTIVRTGTYSVKMPTGAERKIGVTGISNAFNGTGVVFPTATEHYWRAYIYLTGDPTTARVIMNDFANGSALRLNTDRTLTSMVLGGATFETSVATVTTNQWVRVELHVKRATNVSSADGIVQARIDGTLILDKSNCQTGKTVSDAAVAPDMDCGPHSGSLGVDIYFDDMACNDISGSINNSWVGAGGVVNLSPSSDTATINWVAQNGGSHFSEIDDLPGTIDTTTYIKNTAKTNPEDRWNFADTPSAISSGDTINGIMFGVQGGGTGTTSRSAKFQVRDASNNVSDGFTVDWGINGFETVWPILVREQTWEGTPAALTKSYLDGMMGAVIQTDTTGREVRVTAVWASIDFTPAVVGFTDYEILGSPFGASGKSQMNQLLAQ